MAVLSARVPPRAYTVASFPALLRTLQRDGQTKPERAGDTLLRVADERGVDDGRYVARCAGTPIATRTAPPRPGLEPRGPRPRPHATSSTLRIHR